MKKILLIPLLLSMFIFSCSKNDREQEMIQETITGFYKSLNKRDFEKMTLFVSPRMEQKMSYFKNISEDMVVYKHYKVKNIVVNGNIAVVELECVDMFDNKIICNWNLIKIKDEWKLDAGIL